MFKVFRCSWLSMLFVFIVVCLLSDNLEAVSRSSLRSRSRRPARRSSRPSELNTDVKPERVAGKTILPKRTGPVFKGAFSVGIVLIVFPDTRMPPVAEIKRRLFNFGSMTVADYFKEYSQGLSWPEMMVVGEDAYPKSIFTAPEALGYYCEYDFWHNPLGYKNSAEGQSRADKLRAAAEQHAFKFYKRPPSTLGMPLQSNGRPNLICYAFASKLCRPNEFKAIIRPFYNGRMKSYKQDEEAWDLYKPQIAWSDPLWPNSIPQVKVEGGGGTVCHELGHVLGAPDFYHAPEKHDGVPGVPCLDWAYGPTGPAYCRYIYNGFLKEVNYPTYFKSGAYTLYARKTNPAGDKPVGCFVPSSHPHYIYCIEYVKGENGPLGNPGKQGLLVHVINRTLNSPLFGGPDMCYTYRPDDPWFRSSGASKKALFGGATGRTAFTPESEPASRLPNLLDGGVMIESIQESGDTVTFNLTVKPMYMQSAAYKYSLLPKVSLDSVDQVLPSSFRAECTIQFRGEPVKTEYGFCWSRSKKPKVPTGSIRSVSAGGYFPLYHRDRYSGRITGLRPGQTYYVRAYARNSVGISYSKEELVVKTLPARNNGLVSVPPLLEDNFSGNWAIERFHRNAVDNVGEYIGSTAITTLLKLTAYFRCSLVPKSGQGKSAFDYSRIHVNPTRSRPPFRLKDFEKAMNECENIANKTGMRTSGFGDDFDKAFMTVFGMRISRGSKVKPVEKLTEKTITRLEPYVRESLVNSIPVVVGQDSSQLSPRGHGLSWVLIDGVNDKGEFHIVYPRGKDRDFGRKTGWYKLDVLLVEIEDARIIFGLHP